MQEEIRLEVYRHFVQTGKAPSVCALARSMDLPEDALRVSMNSLADRRMLLLQRDGEVLMAPPFSAVPTAFVVESDDGGSWWANCIWDALGVPAALGRDARVVTSCGCCGDAMHLQVRNASLCEPEGVVHFTVPALRWWDNLVFA